MPSASFLFFVLILLQKVTYGNILRIGRKFTEIFYFRKQGPEPERRPREGATGQGRVPPTGLRGAAAGGGPCPSETPSQRPLAYKSSLTKKP